MSKARASLAAMPLAVIGLLVPALVAAQEVRGVVMSESSGMAISGAMIVLVDNEGARLQTTFTDQSGRYRLAVPGAGNYAIRVLRIGFESWESPAFDMATDEMRDAPLAVPVRAIQLTGLVAEAESQCVVDPGQGERTAALWEEARKALEATKWTENQAPFEFTVRRYERQLAADGIRVRRQRDWTWTTNDNTPFRRRDPNTFRETGYVVVEQLGTRDRWTVHFIVPYPEILLSDVFLRDHCYRVETGEFADSLVGLTFTAIPDREHPQVEGVLWVDPATAALSHLDYSYSNLPPDIPSETVGGRVEFAPLPAGPWIVRAWHVRRPVIRYRPADFQTRWVRTVVGFQETGGEVMDVQVVSRREAGRDLTTFLTGVAFDSTSQQPLAGAEVTLEGTSYQDVTDEGGRFAIAGPFSGEYVISLSHPRVTGLGVPRPFDVLTLDRGATDSVSLAIPPWATVLAGTCVDAGRAVDGVLLGAVASETTGGMASGALVRLFWSGRDIGGQRFQVTDQRTTVQTNENGFFVACGLPVGQPISVQATHGVTWSPVTTLTLGDREDMVRRDGPGWRFDLTVRERMTPTGSIAGVITDSEGTELSEALVELPALRTATRTDSSGAFVLENLPPGDHVVRIRRVGFEPIFVEAPLAPGEEIDISRGQIVMRSNPFELEALIVDATAEQRLRHIERSGYYTRRAEGIGEFVSREDIEEWAPIRFSDVLRHVPGMRVMPNRNYGARTSNRPGLSATPDTRQYLVEASGRPRSVTLGECPPLVYMDGVYMGDARTLDLDQLLSLGQIEAVEVYVSGTQVPAQFSARGSACGVIVIWTR